MVTQFIEADVQEDVMKLDTVPANLYSSTTLKLVRFIQCPIEELLAWAYAIDLMKPMGPRNGRASCIRTYCCSMGTQYLGLWDSHWYRDPPSVLSGFQSVRVRHDMMGIINTVAVERPHG